MKCPFCSNKLRRVKFKSDVLDICPRCKGIWFDCGELVNYIKALVNSEDIQPERTRLFERREVDTTDTTKEKDKICPRCNLVMHRFNYCYDSNIFLDKCPSCHGIWTDSGEGRKIAQYIKHDERIDEIGRELARQTDRLKNIKDLSQLGEDLASRAGIGMLFLPRVIFPISDDEESERFPAITITIISLCVLAFWGELFWIADAERFFRSYGFIARNIFGVGLITSMFFHVGLFHLIGNMYFLWLFGDNVEDRFSRFGYVVFYLCCGIAANVIHSVFNWNSTLPAIGASGAVSGVMGAYMLFYPSAMIKVLFICRIVEVPAWMFLGGWLLLQLTFGLLYKGTGYCDIAWFAHVGGFVFGIIVAYLKKESARRHK